MELVGSASGAAEAFDLVRVMKPDLAVVDYQLPREDGIALSRRLKALPNPPKVLIFSAYSNAALAIVATLAGADGITSKSVLADELLDTIRLVARGRKAIPPISTALIEASAARLDPEDLPIFSMLMNGTPLDQLAAVLGIGQRELGNRIDAMLGRLRTQASQAKSGLEPSFRNAR
jgi:DNA-binding NarL/FixJ family response regulator